MIIDPEPPHRVVNGGVDPHRDLVRILVGDPLVHVEEVAVALADRRYAETVDRFREIKIDAQPGLTHAPALVADLLGRPRGNVAGGKVAVARVLALQVIIALVLGNLSWWPRVSLLLGDPDPAIVAERLGHERQLALMVTGHGNAGRVNLGVAGVGERR